MAGEATDQDHEHQKNTNACPLCGDELAANWSGLLYGARICESCRRSFARCRYWAFFIDGILLALFGWLCEIVCRLVDIPMLKTIYNSAGGFLIFAILLRDGLGGQSLGKRLFGLQATHKLTGTGIGIRSSIVRNLPVMIASMALYILAELKFGPRIGDGMAKIKVIWTRFRGAAPFAPQIPTCHACGYDIKCNVSGKCPECGTPVPCHSIN